MSSFVPRHFGDYPPPLGEEPSHSESPQNLGQTNIVVSEMLQVVNNSVPDPLDDTLQALGDEPSRPERDSGETHIAGVPQIVITVIRASDLTLGLRRIPAGFHVTAVIEWHEPILLPCEPSSKVRISVYASFELGPLLCHGGVLRKFEISVQELLDRSENSHPIVFQPMQGEVVSPCTSLFMTLEQRLSDEKDVAILCSLTTLASGEIDVLMLRTDAGHGLLARYCRMQNSSDLDQSINHFEHALDICPMGHPCRPAALFNLATEKFVNCQATETYLDFDSTISVFQDALDLRPTGHPDRSIMQLHLAIAMLSRFAKHGFQTDVDAAEELLTLLVIQISVLHPAGGIVANDIGEERPAASLLPLSPNQLAYLAEWWSRRDDPRALDEVISLHYDALGYYNATHACRGQMRGNLSIMLITRFERRGNAEDMDQAIALQREALALHPVGHTDQSKSLNNLANQLSTRFNHRGNAKDLDQAIALQKEALALRPVGHTDRSSSLNNLANQLSTRFDHEGNGEDLSESRENLHCALALLAQHDPRRLKVHSSLATIYLSFHRSRLGCTGLGEDTDSLNAAMHHFKAAANFVPGGLLFRLRAGLTWVYQADLHRHDTELEAYATSTQLMDAYMSATASVSSRYSAMKDFPRMVAVDAASCTLLSGDVRHAVELLEQGRTIIWTQMTRLRTPLDSLQTHCDHEVTLIKRFRDLSSLLDRPSASHVDGTPSVNIEAAETQYRRSVEDWNGVVDEIREVEGFSRFLLPPLFVDLQEAARDGPIIQPPTSIQLPTNFDKLAKLVIALREAIGKDSNPKGNQTALIKVSRKSWDDIVRPVVENLAGFTRRGSRIWWCPTLLFNFLPLHAAGEYRANGESLSQQYISSYTTSLTALMRARRSRDRSLSVPFAAIGQNLPDGAAFTLDCVEPELKLVLSLLPPPQLFPLLR
ncbi:hypothetical protein CY34DRAFT_12255 [Suillus luteus UH-Slu-Lm8-n1]|uniref:CHAT domain-containing protein n=1 Tax=Suillus luteus UH-Slu-Lm8-n1 TaxID=930992 RepID=A0A0D0BHJ3_9AGAM|nr:hypothetical protein CY34DRAFT_12255 [Suillus luteus UH-Slu-Lm8-n1]